MFSRKFRPFVSYANARLSHRIRDAHRRSHSAISTHSSFPATLLRINAGLAFKPFWFEGQTQNNVSSIDGQLGGSEDSPRNTDIWTNCLALNRATLMPDTFTMQEIIRTAADNYFEDKENGVSVDRPFIFTIPKGTMLPVTLILLRESMFQFSLQPSLDIPPNDLNHILDEFYSKYADKQDVNEWLSDHKYENASANESEKEWMAK